MGGVASSSREKTQNNPAAQPETKYEITGIVERLELMEEKFGISIDGLYATCEKQTWNNAESFQLTLNFDVTATTGDIDRGFSIRANAYNTQGQLIGTQTAFIDVRQFMGFESKTIQLDVDHSPTKLRLFPTEPI